MKTMLLMTFAIVASGTIILNATNNAREDSEQTAWIFNDTGNCEMKAV
jgi:hypothetical protein